MIENIIRKILSEELQKIKVEIIKELKELQESNNVVELYGETLTAEKAAKILSVSPGKVYEMSRNPQFPSKKVGSRIIIPTRKFFEWLNNDISK
jgi:hypothetical protein